MLKYGKFLRGLGSISTLVQILAFLNKVPFFGSSKNILFGLILSPVIFIWGLTERKSKLTIIQAFAIFFIIAAPLALIYFLLVGYVIKFESRPSLIGTIVTQSHEIFELRGSHDGNTLTGTIA